MINNKQFSVLMAVYYRDDPNLFNLALESVLNNTIKTNDLVLVVDGHITESLDEIIHNTNKKTKVLNTIYLPENIGLARALNIGLRKCKNELIFRADADDINNNDRFEIQLNNFDDNIDILGSSILEMDFKKNPLAYRNMPLSHDEIIKFSFNRNPFNHMTVLYRKSKVLQAGGYPNIHLREDYALWAIMINNNAKCRNLSEVLVKATTGVDMYKRRGGMKYAIAEYELQRHLIKFCDKPLLKALVTGFSRSLIFLLPSIIRGKIYERFLRDSTI